MKDTNLVHLLTLLVLALVVNALMADDSQLNNRFIEVRNTQTKSFTKLLLKAAKTDGEFGLTVKELETTLGAKDLAEETQYLIKGLKQVYFLSNNRRLETVQINGRVSLAGIVDGSGTVHLVWK